MHDRPRLPLSSQLVHESLFIRLMVSVQCLRRRNRRSAIQTCRTRQPLARPQTRKVVSMSRRVSSVSFSTILHVRQLQNPVRASLQLQPHPLHTGRPFPAWRHREEQRIEAIATLLQSPRQRRQQGRITPRGGFLLPISLQLVSLLPRCAPHDSLAQPTGLPTRRRLRNERRRRAHARPRHLWCIALVKFRATSQGVRPDVLQRQSVQQSAAQRCLLGCGSSRTRSVPRSKPSCSASGR